MDTSARHQTQPAGDVQHAQREGREDGAGQPVDDYEKPEFIQPQSADAVRLKGVTLEHMLECPSVLFHEI